MRLMKVVDVWNVVLIVKDFLYTFGGQWTVNEKLTGIVWLNALKFLGKYAQTVYVREKSMTSLLNLKKGSMLSGKFCFTMTQTRLKLVHQEGILYRKFNRLFDVSKSLHRPRSKLSREEAHDLDSPSILRRTENYTWVPKDVSVAAVSMSLDLL